MAHRGPDGAGAWVSPDERVGLGHRRLAIIDLAPASSQPMANEDGTIQIVFNGEIYNHHDLRVPLLAAGHRFITDHSDTEALVHGYEQWGIDGLLARLKGMFAFALWDGGREQLFLVRDRLGIKPLYWTVCNGTVLFASEIKALLRYPGVARAIDPTAMYHYLTGMVTPAPLTMFKGIFKLPAAHVLRFPLQGSAKAWCYWDPLPGPAYDARDDQAQAQCVAEVRDRLRTSVREHLVSDVPVGVFLSGGVDSSSILACMAAEGKTSINSFCVGFRDSSRLNEFDEARKVAAHFGARHHEIAIGEQEMRDSLEPIFWSQDEPLADWVCIPLYHVAGLAAKEVKVVMVGEGADEPFAGYDGYQDFLRVYRLYWSPFRNLLPGFLQRTIAHLAEKFAAVRWDSTVAADFASRAAHDREVFWGGATSFWETQKHAILDLEALPRCDWSGLPEGLAAPEGGYDSFNVIEAFRTHLSRNAAAGDVLGRMIYYELKYRLPELLLMRVDKMTMAHSLEARVPFLDHELIELAMRVPSAWKIRDGVPKSILKQAVRGLIPDSVIDRPKKGFGAPMAEWLRGEFGHEVERTVFASELFRTGWFRAEPIRRLFAAHRSGKRDYAHYLWVLFNLVAWHDRWIAGPLATPVAESGG